MDKRYLLILIIIIVCCINLSIIVNNSDTVGSASAIAGKYVFSIPEGFTLNDNNGNSATIKNNENVTIYYESDLSDSDTYNSLLNHIENKSNNKILSKGTFNLENISIDTAYYQTNDTYKVAFYFEKDNTPFKIIMSNFNYDTDRNLTLDYATYIIQSTRFDYKTG